MSDDSDISGADEDGFLVAEYVLGLLTPAEHERLGRRLEDDPALRADLAFWQTRLASLDAQFAESPAPSALLGRLERRLFGAPETAGFWNSLVLWRSVAAGAAAIAAVAVSINLATPKIDPKLFASQLVAALQAEGSNVSFVALYDPMTASVRLTALSGEQPANQDYELWAIEGAGAPISMGVVPMDGKVQVKLSDAVMSGWGEGTILAVTLEQKGGSPTGAPQGPIVAKGMATAI